MRSAAKIVINRMFDEGVLNFDDVEAAESLQKTFRLINEQQTPQDFPTHRAEQIGGK